MEPTTVDEAEISKRAAKLAEADQERAEWGSEADKYVTFYKRLHEGGLPDKLILQLTVNEQVNYHEESTTTEDDD